MTPIKCVVSLDSHACYKWRGGTWVIGPWKILRQPVLRIKSLPVQVCPLPHPVSVLPVPSDWSGQMVIDPRWGTQDRGPIRPLCGEWTPTPFIIPFQLKLSKKWLNNQLLANGAIYPCYRRTLVIGLGMSGQCQLSHSDAKQVRWIIESWKREESNEEQRQRSAYQPVQNANMNSSHGKISPFMSSVTVWSTPCVLMSLTCAGRGKTMGSEASRMHQWAARHRDDTGNVMIVCLSVAPQISVPVSHPATVRSCGSLACWGWWQTETERWTYSTFFLSAYIGC